MKSEIQIDTENAEGLKKVVGKSLESNEKIGYGLEARKDSLTVKVETESLGQLRGCTDTVFRLTSISKKILDR